MAKKSIQIRLDERLKKKVEGILKGFGLDMPTAARMFFMKVALTESIPFSLRNDEDHYTPEEMAEIEKAYHESFDPKNLSRAYKMPEEFDDMMKDLGLPS